MDHCFFRKSAKIFRQLFSLFLVLLLCFGLAIPPSLAQAQLELNLPEASKIKPISKAFQPVVLKAITVNPKDPFLFDFLIDKGDSNLDGEALEVETQRLVKYFLAALTIPESDLWVNLSPYEKDAMVPQVLGITELGRDLLVDDYILKQVAAALTNPNTETGKKFWSKAYAKAQEIYGTTQVPINTFSKVWIVPDQAVVLEKDGSAFIADSRLKAFLEEDYLAINQNLANKEIGTDKLAAEKTQGINNLSAQVMKDVVLPEIEKEINSGENFVLVRQVYSAVLLATWYKKRLKESILGQLYADKGKVAGVNAEDMESGEKIYEKYTAALKAGVYNIIKQDYDLSSQKVLQRKYFSGGATFRDTVKNTNFNTMDQGFKRLSVSAAAGALAAVRAFENPSSIQKDKTRFQIVKVAALQPTMAIRSAVAAAANDKKYEEVAELFEGTNGRVVRRAPRTAEIFRLNTSTTRNEVQVNDVKVNMPRNMTAEEQENASNVVRVLRAGGANVARVVMPESNQENYRLPPVLDRSTGTLAFSSRPSKTSMRPIIAHNVPIAANDSNYVMTPPEVDQEVEHILSKDDPDFLAWRAKIDAEFKDFGDAAYNAREQMKRNKTPESVVPLRQELVSRIEQNDGLKRAVASSSTLRLPKSFKVTQAALKEFLSSEATTPEDIERVLDPGLKDPGTFKPLAKAIKEVGKSVPTAFYEKDVVTALRGAVRAVDDKLPSMAILAINENAVQALVEAQAKTIPPEHRSGNQQDDLLKESLSRLIYRELKGEKPNYENFRAEVAQAIDRPGNKPRSGLLRAISQPDVQNLLFRFGETNSSSAINLAVVADKRQVISSDQQAAVRQTVPASLQSNVKDIYLVDGDNLPVLITTTGELFISRDVANNIRNGQVNSGKLALIEVTDEELNGWRQNESSAERMAAHSVRETPIPDLARRMNVPASEVETFRRQIQADMTFAEMQTIAPPTIKETLTNRTEDLVNLGKAQSLVTALKTAIPERQRNNWSDEALFTQAQNVLQSEGKVDFAVPMSPQNRTVFQREIKRLANIQATPARPNLGMREIIFNSNINDATALSTLLKKRGFNGEDAEVLAVSTAIIAVKTNPNVQEKERIAAMSIGDFQQFMIDEANVKPEAAKKYTRNVENNVGGIDLSAERMGLRIKVDGNGVPLAFPLQDVGNLKIDGLAPVILDIQNATPQNTPFLMNLVPGKN